MKRGITKAKRKPLTVVVKPVVRVTIHAVGNYAAPPLGFLYKNGDEYVLKSTNDGIHGIPIWDGDVIFPYISPNPSRQPPASGRG